MNKNNSINKELEDNGRILINIYAILRYLFYRQREYKSELQIYNSKLNKNPCIKTVLQRKLNEIEKIIEQLIYLASLQANIVKSFGEDEMN